MVFLSFLQRGYEFVYWNGSHAGHFDSSSCAEFDRDFAYGLIVGGFYDVYEVVWSEKCILTDHFDAEGFEFFVYLFYSCRFFFDGFPAFVGQIGQQNIVRHV